MFGRRKTVNGNDADFDKRLLRLSDDDLFLNVESNLMMAMKALSNVNKPRVGSHSVLEDLVITERYMDQARHALRAMKHKQDALALLQDD